MKGQVVLTAEMLNAVKISDSSQFHPLLKALVTLFRPVEAVAAAGDPGWKEASCVHAPPSKTTPSITPPLYSDSYCPLIL